MATKNPFPALRDEASGSPTGAYTPEMFDAALEAEGVTGHAADVMRSLFQQESGSGRNTRTSNANARGGMQIIPPTFRSVADPDWDIDTPWHNVRAGIRYGMQGYRAAGGDPALTGAHYYGGPGGLKAARQGQARFDPRNPNAPSTLEYGAQVASRVRAPREGGNPFAHIDAAIQEGYTLTAPDTAADMDTGGNPFPMSGYHAPQYEPTAAPPPPDEPPVPTKRTWGQAIGDTAKQVAASVNRLPASLISAFAPDSAAAEFFDGNAETWRSWQSEPYKAMRAAADQRIREAEQAAGGGLAGVGASFTQGVKEAWNNPAIASDYAFSNLVNVAPSLGAIKGAQALGLGVRGALGASAAVNAALNAGDARGEAFERLKKAHMDQGVPEAEATELARSGSVASGVVGGVAGAVGGATGVQPVVAGATRKAFGNLAKGGMTDVLEAATTTSLRKSLGRTAAVTAKEMLGEIPEETAAIPFTNRAVGAVDGKTDLWEGVGGAAAAAMIGSGPLGGYAGTRAARQDAAQARELAVALDDPTVDPTVKARARDHIMALAERNRVAPDQIDAWLDEQFTEDDERQARTDAAERAAQTEMEVAGAQRQRAEEQFSALRWRDETAERRDGLRDQLAPESEFLGGVRDRETMLADEADAAQAQAEADRARTLESFGQRADPLGSALAGRRQAAEDSAVQAARDEEDALQRAMAASQPTSPLVGSPNDGLLSAMGERAARESAPARPQPPAPAPPPTTAQQVASREAERNQRARTEFGIVKTQALATFAELDDALVQGLIDEDQFNVAAGMLAGDAVRLSEVRGQLATIKVDAKVQAADNAPVRPMEGGTPPDTTALEAELNAALSDEPGVTVDDTRTRGQKFVDALNERLQQRGQNPLNRLWHQQAMYLAIGMDIDGNLPEDGILEHRPWAEVARILKAETGKSYSPTAINNVFKRDRGIDPETLKDAFVESVVAGEAGRVNSQGRVGLAQPFSEDDLDGGEFEQEEAAEPTEADVQVAEDGEPGQRAAADEETTELDTAAADAVRAAERGAALNQEVLAAAQITDELAQALGFNHSALNEVAGAREDWDEDSPLGVKFDDLPVKDQAEYVRAVLRNNTFDRDGRPVLSTSDLIRMQDEIAERVAGELLQAGQTSTTPDMARSADTQWEDDAPKKWAGAVRRPGTVTAADVAAVRAITPALGKNPVENGEELTEIANGGGGKVKLTPADPDSEIARLLVAPLRTLMNGRTAQLARLVLPKLGGISFFTTSGQTSLSDANGIFIPSTGSVHLNANAGSAAVHAYHYPNSATAARSLANTVGHEVIQHAADHFAGKALGAGRYATLTPGGPLAIDVERTQDGRVNLTLGPVIKELFDAYRGISAGQLLGPKTPAPGKAGGGTGDAQTAQQPAPDARTSAGVDGGKPANGQAAPGPQGAVGGAAGGPADSSGLIAGRDFWQAFEDLASYQDDLDAGVEFDTVQLHKLVRTGQTATKEAWALLGEAMMTDPLALKAEAPLAYDLINRAWQAQSLEQLGQILSGQSKAAGQARTHAGPKVDAQQRREAPARVAAQANGALKAVQQHGKDSKNWAFLRAAMTTDLVSVAKKYLPSAEPYLNLLRRTQADRVASERNIDSVLDDYYKLSASERSTGPGTVNAFLLESTSSKKWGFKPSWLAKAEVDPGMAAKYQALSPQARKVVERVLRHGHDSIADLRKQALASISHESDALIKAAYDRGDTEGARRAENAKLRSVQAFEALAELDTNWPYAPLKRFGNEVVIFRSNELAAQEAVVADTEAGDAARAAARKRVAKLRANGDHYAVWFRESRREARKLADDVRRKRNGMGVVENFAREAAQYGSMGDMMTAFHRLRDMVDNSTDKDLREKSSAALRQLMTDLHLALLSEQSVRQSGRRREGVFGADEDMMRSFETHGRALANFTASLNNTREIQNQISNMRKEARDNKNPGTTEERQDYFNEILRRHMMGLDYQPGGMSTVVSKVMAGTSVWMLLTSISYHVNNATQPWAMSLPLMAAKHGYGRAQVELIRAYRDVAPALSDGRISQSDFSKLPADARTAVTKLADEGVIMISLEQDMGRWAQQGQNPAVAKVTRTMTKLAQTTEAVNRLATAVAAVRLEQKAGRDGFGFAREVIDRTHGEYAAWNAPRLMRNPLGRLATQFRKFQLIQASLWVRMAHDALKGASPAERKAARLALTYSFAHMGVLGGMVGMPGFALFSWMLNGIVGAFGDDDEMWDTEEKYREAVRSAFGDGPFPDLLVRGLPFAMGVDISGRVAAGDMLSLMPFTDLKATRDGWSSIVTSALGPFVGGVVPRAADGLGLMLQGQVWKGLEGFAPKGVADFSKALRQEAQGVTNKRGDVLITPDELSIMEGIMQGIGFPTTTLTERGRTAGLKYQIEQFYKERSDKLTREFIAARKANDTEAMAEVRKAWMETQTARRSLGMKPQPVSQLVRAAAAQQQRERNTAGGIQYTNANRQFVERLVGVGRDDAPVDDDDDEGAEDDE